MAADRPVLRRRSMERRKACAPWLSQSLNANRCDRSQPLLPYSNDALRNDLIRVHDVWRESRRQHDRLSVYKYLTAVFDLVTVWEKENRAVERAKRALWLKIRAGGDKIEPFAAVIRCTSSRKKVDAKARSKWARALIYAAKYKSPAEPLEHFLRRHGGINLCAAKLSRLSRPNNSVEKSIVCEFAAMVYPLMTHLTSLDAARAVATPV